MSKHEGYLLIDHRASPGISKGEVEKLRKLGHNMPFIKEGSVLEYKTKRCAHCGGVVVFNPARAGHCYKCDKFTCVGCSILGNCKPIEALADAIAGSDKPIKPILLRS